MLRKIILIGVLSIVTTTLALAQSAASKMQDLLMHHHWQTKDKSKVMLFTPRRYFVFNTKKGKLFDWGSVQYSQPSQYKIHIHMISYQAIGHVDAVVTHELKSPTWLRIKGVLSIRFMGVHTRAINNQWASVYPNHKIPKAKNLSQAIQYGDISFIKKYAGDANKVDHKRHNTPLIMAAAYPYPEVLTALINKGAKVNEDVEGNTPLIFAVSNNLLRNVNTLLKAGAHINYVAKNGDSALSKALFEGNFAIVKYLLKQGATPRLHNGKTFLGAVMYKIGAGPAMFADNVDEVRWVLKHVKKPLLHRTDSSGQTPLFAAVRHLLPKCTAFLLQRGANPNHVDHDGNTAIMDTINDLQGSSVSTNGSKYVMTMQTPEFFTIIKDMVKHGAKLNLKNKKGQTALQLAKANQATKLVKLLKSLGAN